MPEPQPSLHDIADLPSFPFEVSATWFAIILITAVVLVCVFMIGKRAQNRAKTQAPGATRVSQLSHCKSLLQKEQLSRIDLDFLSDMARQMLNAHFTQNLLACSRTQLRILSDEIEDDIKKNAVRILAQLEDIRYQRSGAPDAEIELLHRIFNLIDSLEESA